MDHTYNEEFNERENNYILFSRHLAERNQQQSSTPFYSEDMPPRVQERQMSPPVCVRQAQFSPLSPSNSDMSSGSSHVYDKEPVNTTTPVISESAKLKRGRRGFEHEKELVK